MYRAKCYLKSASPLSFSRRYEDKAPKDEDPWDHDQKSWRGRLHTNENGDCFIPASMFKNALCNAAKILGDKIPSKGGNTYPKRFEAGIVVEKDLPLGIKAKDVAFEDIFVSSDGRRGGGGPQVRKRFPKIENWEGCIMVTVILDTIITRKVFGKYMGLAGQIAGIGRYRPEKKGNKGRFTVEKIEYEEIKG